MSSTKKGEQPNPPSQTVSAKTLTALVQHCARLSIERDALQAVLETKRVSKWRDVYDREFLERWENQGAAFSVMHALIREKRSGEVLRNLAKEIGKRGTPDQ